MNTIRSNRIGAREIIFMRATPTDDDTRQMIIAKQRALSTRTDVINARPRIISGWVDVKKKSGQSLVVVRRRVFFFRAREHRGYREEGKKREN